MGGFVDVDEAMIAGARAVSADFGASAGIKPLKIAKRPIYLDIHLQNAVLTGAGVLRTPTGVFPRISMPNANASSFTNTVCAPRGEVTSGEKIKVHIFWIVTGGAAGTAQFIVKIKPAITGTSNLESAVERRILSDSPGANLIQQATLEFPPSIFAPGQLLGLQISRDPDNTLDDLALDTSIVAIYIEINGRC